MRWPWAAVPTKVGIGDGVSLAVGLATALVATIAAAASVKRATMNMVVHAYDLFFYFSSWSTVSYLWSDQRRYMLAAAAALGTGLLISSGSWAQDASKAGPPPNWKLSFPPAPSRVSPISPKRKLSLSSPVR